MKRHGNLWTIVTGFPNLLAAAEKAKRGKMKRENVARFHLDLERNLWELHDELCSKTFTPGAYETFYIYEPKPRLISAAPYRDRVVHHALCRVLETVFEPTFIDDSYACRRGKGTHAAIDRFTEFARRNHYVLKCDIRKFFPSTDHEILRSVIASKIKDPDVMWLERQADAAAAEAHAGGVRSGPNRYETGAAAAAQLDWPCQSCQHPPLAEAAALWDNLLSQAGVSQPAGTRSKVRVLRGGCWNNNSRNCRAAIRNRNNSENRNNNGGCRVLCVCASAFREAAPFRL